MSSDMTSWLGNKLLRWLAGNAMPTAPTTCYFALFDGDPRGAGTEISTDVNAGGRQAIVFAALSSGTGTTLTNDDAIDFGNSDNAVSLTHVAVFDAQTSGQMLWVRELSGGPFTITSGMPVTFNPGAVNFFAGQ